MIPKRCLLAGYLALLLMLLNVHVAKASSNIFDGEIVKIIKQEKKKTFKNKDGTKTKTAYTAIIIHFRAANSPYTSVGAHSRILTTADGKKGGIISKPLDTFHTFYVDDVPVSMEDIKPLLVEGAKIITMENRGWYYFLRVRSRTAENRLGFMTELNDKDGPKALTLRRPQLPSHKGGFFPPGDDSIKKGARMMADGYIHLHPGYYPPLTTEVILSKDTVVKHAGKTTPLGSANLGQWVKPMPPMRFDDIKLPPIKEIDPKGIGDRGAMTAFNSKIYQRAAEYFAGRKAVIVQAEREKMRVEIIPEGYGKWDLVTQRMFPRWGKQMGGMFAGIILSEDKLEPKELNMQKYSERKEGVVKMSKVPAMKTFLLAGGRPQDGEELNSVIYRAMHNGASRPEFIVDGMYAIKGDCAWNGLAKGNFIVAHMRRSRPFADYVHVESENPAAWGTLTAINGDNVSLEAPTVPGIALSGKQTHKIDADAEYYYLGRKLSDAESKEMFKTGALIRVYPARPQTILVNQSK